MTHNTYPKPIPQSIAIFGAAGHIGGPMARYLRFHAPQIRLRLISSNPDRQEQLRQDFPDAEVVHADYFDGASLDAAVAGMQGLLVLTTAGLKEEPAMTNLVAAVKKAGTLIHMIRITGVQPDSNPARIPKALRDFGLGLEIQHPIAREILDDAEIPVTYLNCGASFMDNYLRLIPTIQEHGVVPWSDRQVPYVDPREVGEAAARLLLSDDARHIYQFYTLNNGEPGLRASDVARMMSEVFLRPIRHDGTREALFAFFKPVVDAGLVPAAIPEYLWNFFAYEDGNAPVWVPNQFLERTLGRRPNTMRAWLQEHRHQFFDDTTHVLLRDMPSTGATGSLPETSAPASPIDGVWDCTVSTPVGKEPHELVVRSAPDGTLSGEMKNTKNGQVMPLQNGTYSGNTLKWTMQLAKPIKVTLKVEVQINGTELAGQASAGFVGTVSIRGVKRA